MTRLVRCCFVATAFWAAAAGSAHANATPAPAIRFEPIRRLGPQSIPTGPAHFVFGEIAKLVSPRLVLRLRDGRLLDVDAAAAIESGRFSAPLFAGKLVVIEGRLDALGVMHAESVTRTPRIDEATPKDR
jgi:hypothetical protein